MKPKAFILGIFLLVSSCKTTEAPAFTSYSNITVQSVYQGTDVIWGFDFIDSDHIIFTERGGKLRILQPSTGQTQTLQGVPTVHVDGQAGLLDVALHPQFSENHWLYLSYSIDDKIGLQTRIVRAKLIKDQLKDLQILFTSNSNSRQDIHFGSRIVFDQQGHIFFSVGERGQRNDAQDLSNSNGKVHRLNEDGTIPKDNPFAVQKNAIASIWSYGHRNPQGLFYDQSTSTLWEQEHGPKGGDEINIIQKGKNYGWPVITYGREYSGPVIGSTHKEGMEQPVYHYSPSIAPCGLSLYKGYLYSGSLVLTHLNRLNIQNQKAIKEERLLENLHERVRSVKEGKDGLLYISTDSAKILKLTIF